MAGIELVSATCEADEGRHSASATDKWIGTALILVFFAVVFIGIHPFPDEIGAAAEAVGGDLSTQLTFFFLSVSLLGYTAWSRGLRSLSMPGSVVLCLAWCWASISWAWDPSASFRRVVLLTLIVQCAYAVVRLVPPRVVVDLLLMSMPPTLDHLG